MTGAIAHVLHVRLAVLLFVALTSAFGQLTPSQDAYTDSSKPTTNFGAATTLGVANTSTVIQTSYIQFDLSAIPAGFSGANVAKATLKLYVNTVTTAGSFNVDFVNGSWTEKTLTHNNAPALGTTIASSVSLATANKNDYVLIDITSALEAWLNGTQTNDGIAVVANSPLASSLDSKENTAQSHPAELDVVFNGAITGVDTAADSGLTGGGTSGTLNLSLLKSCNSSQVLQWNGSSWVCSNAGTGTVTGVTAGTDLTGGGTGGNVTLNLDTTKVPQLNTANNFIGNQFISGTLNVTGVVAAGSGIDAVASLFSAATPGDGTVRVVNSSSGNSSAGLYSQETSSSGETFGLQGLTESSGASSAGVQGTAFATSGTTYGVQGINHSAGEFAAGVEGANSATSGVTFGLVGSTNSPNGIGAVALGDGESSIGLNLIGCCPVGVWGDTGSSAGGAAGLVGTAGDARAIYLENNSPSGVPTAFMKQDATGKLALVAGGSGGSCTVDTNGSLVCSGSKSAAVPVDNGQRQVALYAVEAPQNWFEDFGSGKLTNGTAAITLDPLFAQTVNTTDYHVFLTPRADCEGLYVGNATDTGFEVHELHSGRSNASFDYRIVALRRGYENVRLEDKTEIMAKLKESVPKPLATPRTRLTPHALQKLPAMPAKASTSAIRLGLQPSVATSIGSTKR